MSQTPAQQRTVLIVAGEFPPLKTIGRIRTVKFAEHLRSLGWDAVVLTVAASGSEPNYDAALEEEVPDGIEVVRVPLVTFDERITRSAKRLLGHGDGLAASLQSSSGSAGTAAVSRGDLQQAGFFERLQLAVKCWIRLGLDIPDSYLPWALKAVPAAREICARRKIDVIFTTLPPFSAAYVGYVLRGETGIPWVADYRDLWYGDVLREWLPKWRQKLELLIEKRLLKRADVIVTVSEQKTDYMRRIHPQLKARWETLTNGYDAEIYATRGRSRAFDSQAIEFVYTGRLFKNRRGYAFAEAFGRLKQRRPELVAPVKVRILGGVAPEIAARYGEILDRYTIGRHFDFPGDVSYQQAMDAQVNCDWLLLIVDTGETSDGVIPGKLFEYVASQRPMFALCNPGATQQIIERARLGVVVGAEDVDACEQALEKVLEEAVPQSLDRDADYLAQFDRKNISRRLAELLEQTAAARQST
ncbi:MAG: glycosyltransferase [Planctomycetales bacterium]|jgi:glycosyltransferase involved in cell wall biosynthesis|nr:glycosyltransferase [Planctomycetales bacterium]